MTIWPYACGAAYAVLGLVIGVDNHMVNRGLAPGVPRPSAVLRGVFWVPYATLGIAQAIWDSAQRRR